jgi:hypothetical protein
MTLNRKSMITLALVATVGIGLVGAYRSNACDGERASAKQASAKQVGEKKMSGSSCCASSKGAAQASNSKGECSYSKQASGKSECGSKAKGAMQASAGLGADVIPVGGSACTSLQKASGASCKMKGAHGASYADDCDGCKLYRRYASALEAAGREIATLPDGILVHMTSDDAAVVTQLQSYSNEKAELMRAIANKSFEGKLCDYCGEKTRSMQGASFRVANATNGVYTIITSGAPGTVEQLHKIAAAEATANEVKSEG